MLLSEQAELAIKILEHEFELLRPQMPEDATVESLWEVICQLKRKEYRPPRKSRLIRIILEHPQLTSLNNSLIADILRSVYKRNNLDCNTTGSSVGWYVSKKTLEWAILPRDNS